MTDEKHEDVMRVANEFNPFTRVNDIMLTELSDGRAVVEHEVKRESLNYNGVVHGGLIATMMDFAGGAAARGDGRMYVTSDMNVNFIGNIGSGKLTAESDIVSRGGTLCNVHMRVTAEDGKKLIADGTGTYFCIGREKRD